MIRDLERAQNYKSFRVDGIVFPTKQEICNRVKLKIERIRVVDTGDENSQIKQEVII